MNQTPQIATEEPTLSRTIYRAKSHRRWLRVTLYVLLGLFIVLSSCAGGAYIWLHHMVEGAQMSDEDKAAIAAVGGPESPLVSLLMPDEEMDILVVGYDKVRENEKSLSDSIMLLRIDPANDYMAILSIPRDLWVHIPGYWESKINAAHGMGGPALTIETVQNLTGVTIDKYMEVGMEMFPSLIDALGGIYVDVDHYYEYGAKPGETKESLFFTLPAGYQLLSGSSALSYVRYRSDKNSDYGRQARQQNLLTSLRNQASGWDLAIKIPSLVSTVSEGKYVYTNIETNDAIKLAYFMARLQGNGIKQVQITGKSVTINGQSAISLDETILSEAVHDYMTPDDEEDGTTTASSSTGTKTTGNSTSGATSTTKKKATTTTAAPTTGTSMLDTEKWTAQQKTATFQLQAPTYLPADFAYYSSNPTDGGTYSITTDDGGKPAVKFVYRYKSTDKYIGVGATTWTSAPLAASGKKVEEGGITYNLVYRGKKVDHIWWVEDNVLYWVSNTIFFDVSRDELLNMAQSMEKVPGFNGQNQ